MTYTSIPTFTSSSIGYILPGSTTIPVFPNLVGGGVGAGNFTTLETFSITPGVYMLNLSGYASASTIYAEWRVYLSTSSSPNFSNSIGFSYSPGVLVDSSYKNTLSLNITFKVDSTDNYNIIIQTLQSGTFFGVYTIVRIA